MQALFDADLTSDNDEFFSCNEDEDHADNKQDHMLTQAFIHDLNNSQSQDNIQRLNKAIASNFIAVRKAAICSTIICDEAAKSIKKLNCPCCQHKPFTYKAALFTHLKNVHSYDSAALDAFSSTLFDVHLIKPIKTFSQMPHNFSNLLKSKAKDRSKKHCT